MKHAHHHVVLPPSVARGPRAAGAMRAWCESWLRRGKATLAAATTATPPRFAVGTGVWCMVAMDDGTTSSVRAQVLGHDALTGRHHLANIDDPHRQWYAGADRIMPRYAGEVAPGITARDGSPAPRFVGPAHPFGRLEVIDGGRP